MLQLPHSGPQQKVYFSSRLVGFYVVFFRRTAVGRMFGVVGCCVDVVGFDDGWVGVKVSWNLSGLGKVFLFFQISLLSRLDKNPLHGFHQDPEPIPPF